MTEEVCCLALYIEPDVTIAKASEMLEKLFSMEDDMVSLLEGYEIENTGLYFSIEYYDSGRYQRTNRIRKLAAELGFKEDWDEMSEWGAE